MYVEYVFSCMGRRIGCLYVCMYVCWYLSKFVLVFCMYILYVRVVYVCIYVVCTCTSMYSMLYVVTQRGFAGMFRPEMLRPMGLPEDVR